MVFETMSSAIGILEHVIGGQSLTDVSYRFKVSALTLCYTAEEPQERIELSTFPVPRGYSTNEIQGHSSGEPLPGFEPSTWLYKSRAFPTKLKGQEPLY